MVGKNSKKFNLGKKQMKKKIKEIKQKKLKSTNLVKPKASVGLKDKFNSEKDENNVNKNTSPNTHDTKYDSFFSETINRNYMLIKSDKKWFENETIHLVGSSTDLKSDYIKQYATKLMEKELILYKRHIESRKKRADSAWIQTVLKNGTISDRMAAMTLLIQESPVHNLHNLDNLIALVNIKAKRECPMAVDTLRDLFLSDLLLDDRKLGEFSKRPFSQLIEAASGNHDTVDRHLLLWYFEDELKKRYVNYVETLDTISRDIIESTKTKAISTLYELIVSKSENEQMILKKLVNKLGDPKHKVAAFVVQRLNRLADHHPNMKPCIVDEVENLIFRTNIQPRAQYYGVCFLNQILLSEDDSALASHLIAIYFGFFKACVKRSEVNSKMMSALLTGVNRAYPYTSSDVDKINEQINVMFKVVQTVRFHIGVQALMLIYQVLDTQQSMSDRYYSALYRKILDPQMKHSTRLPTFFNLVYKSMQKDENIARIQAFVKRLLQISQSMAAPIACAILILISEIVKKKPKAVLLKQNAVFCADDDEEHFKDVDMDDGIVQPGTNVTNLNEVQDQDEDDKQGEEKKNDVNQEGLNDKSSQNTSQRNFLIKNYGLEGSRDYAALKRNPRYANAEYTCAWELLTLCSHSHPSVALFAQNILNSESISYAGDPLQDFTLIRFLDRFVYRNPKSVSVNENTEKKRFVFGRRQFYIPDATRRIPVNSKNYSRQNEKTVPIDEMYLYHYFAYANESKIVKQTKDEDGSDNESVNSEEFEEFLSKYEKDERDEPYIDFASELKPKQKHKAKVEESTSGSESDYEDDFEEDEEYADAFKEFDEEIADAKTTFDEETAYSSEEWDEDFTNSKIKTTKRKGKELNINKSKKFKKGPVRSSTELNIGTDEFAEMMDENAASGLDSGLLTTLSNKDNADVKQLKWEISRDQWIRNSDWKSKKQKNKTKLKNKNKMATNRPNQNRKNKTKKF